MATPDRSIDPRILDSAKKEFLTHGFEKASLKAICENAGVTTGALYKRYKSKEDLFIALVADTVTDLMEAAKVKSSIDLNTISDEDLMQAWYMDVDNTMWWFHFLYERHDGFLLLLTCSQGTCYSHFQHDWVEIMNKATYAFLEEAQKRKLCRKISKEELHIMLTGFWATIYEPFIHNFSWDQIKDHCKIICKLFNWWEALEFSPA